jgi:hypothetical protein
MLAKRRHIQPWSSSAVVCGRLLADVMTTSDGHSNPYMDMLAVASNTSFLRLNTSNTRCNRDRRHEASHSGSSADGLDVEGEGCIAKAPHVYLFDPCKYYLGYIFELSSEIIPLFLFTPRFDIS